MAQKPQAVSEKTEAYLRLVIDTIPTMVWSLLPGGRVDFINQRWLDYTGLSKPEALEDSTHIIHPEDFPKVAETLRVAMATVRQFEDEMRMCGADGKYRWFLVRGVPQLDEQGNVVKWYGTSTDIEDRKQAEYALRQREFELAEAQRVAQLGSWVFNIAGDRVEWSGELYRIFDVDKSAFGGTYATFLSRIHPDDRARVLQANFEARSDGKSFKLEYRINTRGDNLKHIREIGYARKDAQGVVTDLFGTAQDITEYKRAENALRDASAQLQGLSRRLVELQEFERKELSRELHDRVGQNLTALNINLSILRDTLPPEASDERRGRLDDSRKLIESTIAAIRDVMSELRPPMLDELGLPLALNWYARQVSARSGVSIAVHDLVSVQRPAPKMEIALFRIVQEALNNVVKHAGANRVEITLQRSGAEYVMSVQDDGVGFDPTEVHAEPHPGLGMVTMRERSQAVGGRFEVQTFLGTGTLLTVWVPA